MSQLDHILAVTRRKIVERKSQVARAKLEQMAASHQPRGFARALRERALQGPAIIAEVKKASPSRGIIREDFDPVSLARGFYAAGAAALSVLTEGDFFQGSLRNLELASETSGLPCLRKDFIVDDFQILEARAYRADAILLIAAALSAAELSRLAAEARRFELDVLLEVHSAEELDRVLALGCSYDAIGVNNRNLRTFAVNLESSLELAPRLPAGAVRVSESGLETAADLHRLRGAGYHAFLMGESLMRQPDPGLALANLISATKNLAGGAVVAAG